MEKFPHATRLGFAHPGMCHQSELDFSALFLEFPILKDDNVKPGKNAIFMKNDKMVIFC